MKKEWVNIEESLPDYFQQVFVTNGYGVDVCTLEPFYYEWGGRDMMWRTSYEDWLFLSSCRHWMPLYPAPERDMEYWKCVKDEKPDYKRVLVISNGCAIKTAYARAVGNDLQWFDKDGHGYGAEEYPYWSYMPTPAPVEEETYAEE